MSNKTPKTKWSHLGGEVIDLPRPKVTRKVKEYTEPELLTQYFLERDRVIWEQFPNSRNEIEIKYGKTKPD